MLLAGLIDRFCKSDAANDYAFILTIVYTIVMSVFNLTVIFSVSTDLPSVRSDLGNIWGRHSFSPLFLHENLILKLQTLRHINAMN